MMLVAGGTGRAEPAAVVEPVASAPSSESLNPPAPAATALSAFPLTAFAAIGSSFAKSSHLDELGWNEEQIAAFVDGVGAAIRGKGYAFDEVAQQVSAEMGRRQHELKAQKALLAAKTWAEPGKVAQFMKDARKHLSLQQSSSGLAYSIQPGISPVRPRPHDTVVVTILATAADRTTKLPQLSSDHLRIKLEDLLPGFMEGFQMMTVGSNALFVLPPALSFGENKWPEGVDHGMPLLYQVTLHEVIAAEASP